MTKTTTSEAIDNKLVPLRAAVGEIAGATGSIDMALVLLLSRIIVAPYFRTTDPKASPQDLKLASHIVFGQPSIERRIDITRKILTHRLGFWLSRAAHEYEHKAATFIIKAFNAISKLATEDVWIRNLAVHGDSLDADPPTIIPSPFDFENAERLHRKRGFQGEAPLFTDNGLTIEEIKAATKKIREAQLLYMRIIEVMAYAAIGIKDQNLEDKLVALGKDLKLTPPLLRRPPRGKTRREKRGPSRR